MKRTIATIILLLGFSVHSSYGYESVFSREKIEQTKNLARSLAEKERTEMKNEASPFISHTNIDYKVDTLRISILTDSLMAANYTTAGMIGATYIAEDEYLLLMDKYIKSLESIYKGEDLQAFKAAQAAWENFNEQENKIIYLPMKYMQGGAGTMHRLLGAGARLAIIKQRVEQLYQYVESVKEN